MEALVWETAEEIDMKLAQRVRNIRRRRKIYEAGDGGGYGR